MNTLAPLLIALLLPVDRVSLVSGEQITGEVREARLDRIVIAGGDGVEHRLEPAEVLGIEFGPVPEPLLRAHNFLEVRDYQNAVASFEAAADAGGPPWVAEMARLGRAEALGAWSEIDPGRAVEAVDAYRNWIAAYTDSFFQIQARRGLGAALGRAGKVEEGAKLLEELSSLGFEKNLGSHVEYAARLDRARVYLGGDQAQVAETRLRDLVPKIQGEISSPETGRGVRAVLRRLLAEAQVTLGDAITRRGDPAAARAYWEGLLRDSHASVDVRAAAEIGVAMASLAAGKAREAQLRLARVVATLEASPAIQAQALFRLGEACRALQDDLAPARPYWEQVVRDFPSTPWAAKARAALDG